MSRPKNGIPSYGHHKPSGQAYVRFITGGVRRFVYLGEYDTPESRAEYRRIIAELETDGSATVAGTAESDLTVN